MLGLEEGQQRWREVIAMLGVVVLGFSVFAFGGMLLILVFVGSQTDAGFDGEQGDDPRKRLL